MAVKQRGGNWLREGNLESIIARLHRYAQDPSLVEWIDKKVPKYYKNELATPEDPVRALAEQGISHREKKYRDIKERDRLIIGEKGESKREQFGGEQLGQSALAKYWEDLADSIMRRTDAGDYTKEGHWTPEWPVKTNSEYKRMLDKNQWLAEVSAETPVYGVSEAINDRLGMYGLTKALQSSLDDQSLPPALRWKPEDLRNVSVPQAVKRVHDINAFREQAALEANRRQLEHSGQMGKVFKEYPEQGMKWVELALPTEDPGPKFVKKRAGHSGTEGYVPINAQGEEILRWDELRKSFYPLEPRPSPQEAMLEGMLVTEGNLMGHCVGQGGYCEGVTGGRKKIYSLRDAKGEPHATIEVTPLDNGFPLIQQIKGKQNAPPVDKYLPAIQDFVTSNRWASIKPDDAPNAGLRDAFSAFSIDELERAKAAGIEIPEHGWLSGSQMQDVWSAAYTPEQIKNTNFTLQRSRILGARRTRTGLLRRRRSRGPP